MPSLHPDKNNAVHARFWFAAAVSLVTNLDRTIFKEGRVRYFEDFAHVRFLLNLGCCWTHLRLQRHASCTETLLPLPWYDSTNLCADFTSKYHLSFFQFVCLTMQELLRKKRLWVFGVFEFLQQAVQPFYKCIQTNWSAESLNTFLQALLDPIRELCFFLYGAPPKEAAGQSAMFAVDGTQFSAFVAHLQTVDPWDSRTLFDGAIFQFLAKCVLNGVLRCLPSFYQNVFYKDYICEHFWLLNQNSEYEHVSDEHRLRQRIQHAEDIVLSLKRAFEHTAAVLQDKTKDKRKKRENKHLQAVATRQLDFVRGGCTGSTNWEFPARQSLQVHYCGSGHLNFTNQGNNNKEQKEEDQTEEDQKGEDQKKDDIQRMTEPNLLTQGLNLIRDTSPPEPILVPLPKHEEQETLSSIPSPANLICRPKLILKPLPKFNKQTFVRRSIRERRAVAPYKQNGVDYFFLTAVAPN